MSSINKIRYINVNYNGTARVIPDLTFNFGGENSVMLMPNGGGKSVLVQMSIAALMSNPKLRNFKGQMNAADRDGPKRSFDYFMTSPCPTVIIFEWNLEDGGRFLCGSVFRKPVNETSETGSANPVIWQGFACEYSESCPVDIDNIPLIAGTKTKPVFLSRKEMTDTLKSLAASYREEFGFRYYNLNDSTEKARYFSRLESRGVHQREWESIIRTINQEEGGAAAYFRNNAVERKLAASILVPTVVEKIDPSGSVIDGFRNAFAKYAANRMEHEDVLEGARQKQELLDDIEKFRIVLSDYVQKADGRAHCAAEAATQLRAAEDCASAAKAEMATVAEQKKANAVLLADSMLKKLSLDYYIAKSGLSDAEARFVDIHGKAGRLAQDLKIAKGKKGRLEVARALEEYRTAKSACDKIEGEIEAIRGDSKDDVAEIEQLRKSISAYYTRDICALELQRKGQCDRIAELAAEMKSLESDKRRATEEALSCSRSLGNASVLHASFNAAVEHFNSTFGTDFTPGVDGCYVIDAVREKSGFASHLADAEALLGRTEEKITAEKQIRLEAASISEKAKADRDRAAYGKSAAEERFSAMERALAFRTSVCSVYIGADTDYDVFDTASITDMLQDAMRRKDLLIKEKESHLRLTEAEHAKIEGGQLCGISADIAAALDVNGISYVPGLKWLSEMEISETDMNRLLDENPLLPYAVVVSKDNIEKLHGIRSLLPFMSDPLIAVEPDSVRETVQNGGPVFITNFNRLLLKPGAIKAEAERLERQAASDTDYISRRTAEKNQLFADICRISNDGLTASEYAAAKAEIASYAEQLEKSEREAGSADKTAVSSDRKLEALYSERAAGIENVSACKLACKSFAGLLLDYERYQRDMAESKKASKTYDEAMARTSECDRKIAEDAALTDECTAAIGTIDEQIAELVRMRYPYWVSDEFPDNRIGKVIERKIADWESPGNAIGRYEVLTGKVKGLLDEAVGRRDSAALFSVRKKAELELQMRKNGIAEKDIGFLDPYTPVAYERIETQIAEMEDELQKLHDKEVEVSGDKSHCETVLAQVRQTMKNAGHDEPLPEECIEQKDYGKMAEYLKKTDGELDARLSAMEKTADRLETLISTMAAYRLYSAPTLASERIVEEYRRTGDTEQLRKACIAAADACKKADMMLSDAAVMRTKEIDRLAHTHSDRGLGKILTKIDYDTRNAENALKNLDGISRYLTTMLETERRAADSIRRDLKLTAESGVGYMESVSSELNRIGAKSTILIGGTRRKMVSVSAPTKERDTISYEIEQYLSRRYAECLAVRAKNKAGDYREAIDRITTESLYDEVFGFDKIRVTLIKIETGGLRQCSWSEAASQSGGENLFACLSLIFSLISYLRSDGSDLLSERCERIPVPLDNIFGAMSAEHLIDPFFELARQNNIQLICYTGLTEKAIISPFSNIYKLELAKAGKKEIMYISEGSAESVDNESEMVIGQLRVSEAADAAEEAGNEP